MAGYGHAGKVRFTLAIKVAGPLPSTTPSLGIVRQTQAGPKVELHAVALQLEGVKSSCSVSRTNLLHCQTAEVLAKEGQRRLKAAWAKRHQTPPVALFTALNAVVAAKREIYTYDHLGKKVWQVVRLRSTDACSPPADVLLVLPSSFSAALGADALPRAPALSQPGTRSPTGQVPAPQQGTPSTASVAEQREVSGIGDTLTAQDAQVAGRTLVHIRSVRFLAGSMRPIDTNIISYTMKASDLLFARWSADPAQCVLHSTVRRVLQSLAAHLQSRCLSFATPRGVYCTGTSDKALRDCMLQVCQATCLLSPGVGRAVTPWEAPLQALRMPAHELLLVLPELAVAKEQEELAATLEAVQETEGGEGGAQDQGRNRGSAAPSSVSTSGASSDKTRLDQVTSLPFLDPVTGMPKGWYPGKQEADGGVREFKLSRPEVYASMYLSRRPVDTPTRQAALPARTSGEGKTPAVEAPSAASQPAPSGLGTQAAAVVPGAQTSGRTEGDGSLQKSAPCRAEGGGSTAPLEGAPPHSAAVPSAEQQVGVLPEADGPCGAGSTIEPPVVTIIDPGPQSSAPGGPTMAALASSYAVGDVATGIRNSLLPRGFSTMYPYWSRGVPDGESFFRGVVLGLMGHFIFTGQSGPLQDLVHSFAKAEASICFLNPTSGSEQAEWISLLLPEQVVQPLQKLVKGWRASPLGPSGSGSLETAQEQATFRTHRYVEAREIFKCLLQACNEGPALDRSIVGAARCLASRHLLEFRETPLSAEAPTFTEVLSETFPGLTMEQYVNDEVLALGRKASPPAMFGAYLHADPAMRDMQRHPSLPMHSSAPGAPGTDQDHLHSQSIEQANGCRTVPASDTPGHLCRGAWHDNASTGG